MSRILIIITFVFLNSLQGFSQEGPLKDFTENNENSELPRFSKICLYPSTLRMINVSRDEAYNKLVKDVEKILIYRLDSNFLAKNKLSNLFEKYKSLDFEEYASIKSSKQDMVILGNSDGTNEMVGSFSGGDAGTVLFYMRGSINWQKIPTLMKNFQGNDMVNVFDLVKFGPD